MSPPGIRVRSRIVADERANGIVGGGRLDLDEPIHRDGVTVIKNYSKVVVLRVAAGGIAWYVKWYRLPSARLRLKAALRPSPAQR